MMRQTYYAAARSFKAAEPVDLINNNASRQPPFLSIRFPRGNSGRGEEGPTDGPELELVGASALFVSVPTLGAAISISAPPSSKRARNEYGTSIYEAVRN